MSLSVGIGLTNDCNLNCAHCYRPTDQTYSITLEQVQAICSALDVSAMGMGTGENGLHPRFVEIVAWLREQGIKLTMASNGYTLNTLPDDALCSFHDVEVSIDFPSEAEQDLFRGRGNWNDVHAAMDRCHRLGIEVSILATMMNTNYDKMDELVKLARQRGANLRVNVYQPVRTDGFRLSYGQFWSGYRLLFDSSQLVSCTEPVVRAALGHDVVSSPCGYKSIRVTPQGSVAPCVYWPNSPLTLADLQQMGSTILQTGPFEQARRVPAAAQDCRCQGGCASRRALMGDLNRHDFYCPWVRGDDMQLTADMATPKDLPRSGNVCTTIVI